MKKKIVIAHLLNNYTGSPQVLSHSIEALNREGWDIDLYTSKGPGFLDIVPVNNWFPAWYRWHNNKYIRLIHFAISQFLLFIRLFKYWREPVVIYVNTLLPAGAALAGWLMRKQVIYHIHETVLQPPIFTKLLLAIVKLTANRLIFVSEYLQKFHHIPNIPQEVIYNAIPGSFIKKAANQLKENQRGSNGFEVLMMCSLKKAKGIFEYIQLARQLPDIQFKLVISQTQEHIDKFLNGVIIPTNLHLYPVQQDVHPFYASANLLVSLSHPIEWPETFGMTILEGMTYGLPSIVPPVGAPMEIVEEGREGFHIDMRNLNQVAEKVVDLSSNPSKWEELSKGAKDKSFQFSMGTFKGEVAKCLEKMAE